jgi:EmrB/QacA subfamily drug resistance transporter
LVTGQRTQARPAAPGLREDSRRWVLAAAILGSGIVFLDGTVVNVALPQIGRQLPSHLLGTLEAQTYVYNGYLLTLSALLVLAGALSDEYGRKRTFVIGLAGFGLASLLCGLAPSIELLIAFRVLQGAAGALLVPGSLALLRVNFEGEEQGRAYGLWAAGTSLMTLGGPFLGGLLVDTVGWRAAFLVNLPLVAVAVYASLAHLPESRDEEAQRGFDWIGAALFALAVGGLSFGTIYGEQRAWRSPAGWLLVALGLASAVALPFWLRRARHPLIPPSLFRSRVFTTVNLSTVVIYGALYVSGYYLPLYLQGIIGYSAAAAGLLMLPGSVLLILISPRAGRLAAVVGPRPFLVAGPLLMAAGVAWYARLPQNTTPWHLDLGNPQSLVPPANYWIDFFPAILLFGLGIALLVTPLTTALMGSVPAHNSGVASAFNNALSRVGPQLAGALVFVGVSATFYARLGAQPAGVSPLNRPADARWLQPALQASTDAFHLAMALCVALLLAGAAINLAGLRRDRPRLR